MSGADVLVVGGDGRIGGALGRFLRDHGLSVHASTRRASLRGPERPLIDLLDDDWSALGGARYRAAVIAAGPASIAACAADPEGTWRINVEQVSRLAARLGAAGTRVVLVSTSQVFDGRRAHPKASDAVSPTDAYGRQKAEAERRVLSVPGAAVLRVSKVLTPDLPVLQTWLHDLLIGRTIHPFSDRMLAPVTLAQTCEVLHRMIRREAVGIRQFSAGRDISYADLGWALAAHLGVDPTLVHPVPQPAGPDGGEEIRLTAFDVTDLRDGLGVEAPDPLEVVARVLDELVAVA